MARRIIMRIPFISEALDKRNAQNVARIVDALPKAKLSDKGEKFIDILGGVVDFPYGALSNEVSISQKILQANKEWVYRNNDVIAMEVSKMEFELYSVGLKNGEIVYNQIESHPLLDLLDKPNAETTKSDALYIIQSHKKLAGDAFWLKIRNGKTIKALRPLPPDKVTLKLREPTETDPTVIEYYKYEDTIDNQKVSIIYQPEDIIHLKKPNPNNYFRGYGAVEALAETIDVDNLTNLTTKNFFKRGAITNTVFSTESKVTDDQIKRIQAEMRSMYGGAQNAYRTMVLGGGLTPQKLSFSNKDMEFLAQLAWYRDKIMVGFGNTLASLGMLDDVNRATHESSMIEWKRSTCKPDMDAILNSLNEFLVPEFGNNLLLAYVDPIPEDRTDDIAEATELYAAGIIMLNEARELTDYESVTDGDKFYSAPTPTFGLPLANPDENVDADAEVQNIENEEGEGNKTYRSKLKITEIPKSLAHIEHKALLRQRGIYMKLRQNMELKDAMKPLLEQVVKEHKKRGQKISVQKAAEILASRAKSGEYAPPTHTKFSSDEIMGYYHKQIHDVEVVETHFDLAVQKFLLYVHKTVIDKMEIEIEGQKSVKAKKEAFESFKAKDVFDDNEDEFMSQAQLDFTPLLENLSVIAGQDAYKLVGVEDPYLTSRALKTLIADNVAKFTGSMLDTDRQHIINVITNGIESGQSVVDIRTTLSEDLDYTKMQATRITRTEVLRTSVQSAKDAWEQSGVVEGVQWVTAGATDECADYEGQIETLDANFYSIDSEFQDGNPPIHPNCRCVLIPIVVGNEEKMIMLDRKAFRDRIKELEATVDRRTKAFKKAKQESADDKAYIKALEGLIDGTTQQTE
ncbi:MAG: phage portal protein [Nitrospirae bacterium]|nr:MAG: phage portal protein [Nitrospirota bacterium]